MKTAATGAPMIPATAADIEAEAPTTASMLALAEARQLRAGSGYVHDSIARKMAEGRSLQSPEMNARRKHAKIPTREWGRTFLEVDQQHLAGLQTPLLDDGLFRYRQHARF